MSDVRISDDDSPGASGPPAWGGLILEATLPLGPRDLTVELRTRTPRLALVGPSGAGKSSLVRVLAGVERRARARVEVDGVVWQDPDRGVVVPPWSRRVGWVPQDVLLFPHLSVRQNLAYGHPDPGGLESMAAAMRVGDLLDRRPARLSGGERQRVALGRALLSRPRLLLLDEPFSALDRALRDEVITFLDDWTRAHAIPFLLVSHDERDTRALAEECWRLTDDGLVRAA